MRRPPRQGSGRLEGKPIVECREECVRSTKTKPELRHNERGSRPGEDPRGALSREIGDSWLVCLDDRKLMDKAKAGSGMKLNSEASDPLSSVSKPCPQSGSPPDTATGTAAARRALSSPPHVRARAPPRPPGPTHREDTGPEEGSHVSEVTQQPSD